MFELLSIFLVAFALWNSSQVIGEDFLLPLISILLIMLPLIFIIFTEKRETFVGLSSFKNIKFLSMMLTTVFSLFFIPYLGFPLMSSVLVVFYLMFLGEKRFLALFVTVSIWNLIIYGIFLKMLHVPIPLGEFWGVS